MFKKKYFSNTIQGTAWLTLGQMSLRFSKLVLVAIAIYFMGAHDYGTFAVALAFSSLFFIVASIFHILSPMVRDIVSSSEDQHHIIQNNFSWRLTLGILAFCLILLGSVFFDASFPIVFLIGFSLFFDYIKDFFCSLFESQKMMKTTGIIFTLQACFSIVLGVLFLLAQPTVIFFSFSLFLTSFISFCISFFYTKQIVNKKILMSIRYVFPPLSFVKKFVRDGLGFGLFWAMANNFLFQLILVVLSYQILESEIAIFSIVFQLIQTFLLPYIMFANSSLPRVSHHINSLEISKKIQHFLKFFSITTPLFVGIFSVSVFVFIPFVFVNSYESIQTYFINFGIAPLFLLPFFVGIAYSMMITHIFTKYQKIILISALGQAFLLILFMIKFGSETLNFLIPIFYAVSILIGLYLLCKQNILCFKLPSFFYHQIIRLFSFLFFLIALFIFKRYIISFLVLLIPYLVNLKYYWRLLSRYDYE